MDAYEVPESKIEINPEQQYNPIKGVLYGLMISIGLTLLVSAIQGGIFAGISGVDIEAEGALSAAMGDSIEFLVVDLLIGSLIFYYAGTKVRIYAVSREIRAGLVLACITLAAYVPLFMDSNSFVELPLWYNVAALISMFSMILYGSKPRI